MSLDWVHKPQQHRLFISPAMPLVSARSTNVGPCSIQMWSWGPGPPPTSFLFYSPLLAMPFCVSSRDSDARKYPEELGNAFQHMVTLWLAANCYGLWGSGIVYCENKVGYPGYGVGRVSHTL